MSKGRKLLFDGMKSSVVTKLLVSINVVIKKVAYEIKTKTSLLIMAVERHSLGLQIGIKLFHQLFKIKLVVENG